MRAGPASRIARRQASRPHELTSKAAKTDARLGQIFYLHGWWYAVADYLGFVGVRIRLPGDVSGPSPGRAKQCSRSSVEFPALRANSTLTYGRITERSAEYRKRIVAAISGLRPREEGTILRNHFRLDAVCAGAYGEAGAVELAMEPAGHPAAGSGPISRMARSPISSPTSTFGARQTR